MAQIDMSLLQRVLNRLEHHTLPCLLPLVRTFHYLIGREIALSQLPLGLRIHAELLISGIQQLFVCLTVPGVRHHQGRRSQGQFGMYVGLPRVDGFAVRRVQLKHRRLFGGVGSQTWD